MVLTLDLGQTPICLLSLRAFQGMPSLGFYVAQMGFGSGSVVLYEPLSQASLRFLTLKLVFLAKTQSAGESPRSFQIQALSLSRDVDASALFAPSNGTWQQSPVICLF